MFLTLFLCLLGCPWKKLHGLLGSTPQMAELQSDGPGLGALGRTTSNHPSCVWSPALKEAAARVGFVGLPAVWLCGDCAGCEALY